VVEFENEVVEFENELELDPEDEVLDLGHVVEEITEPEEIVCKNLSRARDKCGDKGR
ncbi:hypothetical protein Tco_1180557, partial [Tanacetum coccineum]